VLQILSEPPLLAPPTGHRIIDLLIKQTKEPTKVELDKFMFQIVLVNQGDIDAIFSLVPDNSPDSRFYDFRFDPVEGIVLPGGHQAVEIMFRSENLGKFSQDFRFSIDASPEQLELTIK